MTASLATGRMAGQTAEFETYHRCDNTSPAVFEATVTVPVSFEDITAALWVLVNGGWTLPDVRATGVHTLVMSVLVNDNRALADAHDHITALTPGGADAVDLVEVRALVTEVYGRPTGSLTGLLGGE